MARRNKAKIQTRLKKSVKITLPRCPRPRFQNPPDHEILEKIRFLEISIFRRFTKSLTRAKSLYEFSGMLNISKITSQTSKLPQKSPKITPNSHFLTPFWASKSQNPSNALWIFRASEYPLRRTSQTSKKRQKITISKFSKTLKNRVLKKIGFF